MFIFPTPSEGVERWDENVGKWPTFGRWEWCSVWGNAAAAAHLWKVG